MAAGLMLSGMAATQTVSAAEGPVHCYGINACKGKGACKGQGWLPTKSAGECAAQGGTVK